MGTVQPRGHGLEWSAGHERVRVEAWGEDSIRVRVGHGQLLDGLPGALSGSEPLSGEVKITSDGASLTNGRLRVSLSGSGAISFSRSDSGEELLAEEEAHFWWPGARLFIPTGNGPYRMEQRFRAYPDEKLFGLGQHRHGRLDQKGLVMDLVQRNAEISVPFLLSSRGYGFLWNSPAVGRVELAENGTRWVADSARQIDYWVTAGDEPAQILSHYADATGHAPQLPAWASGFWQSKLRYRTEDELLAVAREYRERGITPSVIVCDYFHWPHLGDWRFDPEEWPNPAAMVAELDAMGTRLMVSVWPSVSPLSENYGTMLEEGLLIDTDHSAPLVSEWPDRGLAKPVGVAFYDPTNERARQFIWQQVREHYYELGIQVWWLDACEPEINPGYPANLRFAAGPGLEVANLYPREHARAFYEGMISEGETEVLVLCRSAWAGSQRYGAAVWSGDTQSSFASLQEQIRAGLNLGLSGIPWWGSDIGGFWGGDPASPYFRELVARWFEFGAFSPIFRLHGFREPLMPLGADITGGPNEIWSFGDEVYAVMREFICIRERLRPYIHSQMDVACQGGLPLMRPLFIDFPDDAESWATDDEFMFGTDLLVAPVAVYEARERDVYLPAGATWTDAWSGQPVRGGVKVTAAAPLDRIPLFLRDGATLPLVP